MDPRLLVESLSGPAERIRAAREALAAQGAAAVGPVLEVLCDEQSPIDWTVSADVLCRIGEPALLPLADAAASAGSPETARRVAWTLGGLDVDDPGIYEPLLNHPHPAVRSGALYAIQARAEAAGPLIERLAPSLGDPDSGVRERAVRAFQAIGAATVPHLQQVRRRPATGPRIRAGALEALASIAGPDGLDARDRHAWRRLTRIHLSAEVPDGFHLCGSWYAVPTADQGVVLDAFALGSPEPVTLRTGAAAWNHDHHAWNTAPHASCARVFVSPELDGWTLVFGDASEDTHTMRDADGRSEARELVVRNRCADLAGRFGSAHWYGMSCGDGWTAWCIAEAGEVVRYYDVEDAGRYGDDAPRHPAEAGLLLPHEPRLPDGALADMTHADPETLIARYRQLKEQLQIPDTCYADTLAARLSVDPAALDAGTRVRGHGVLALTTCGQEHGHPAGALPA